MESGDGHPKHDITSFVGKVREQDGVEFREGVRVLAQIVMGRGSARTGVGRYERNSE
jgi:hypothetical protein